MIKNRIIIYYSLFLALLLSSCSRLAPVRYPSSLEAVKNCITLSKSFTKSDKIFPHMVEMEVGSVADQYKDTLKKLHIINTQLMDEQQLLSNNRKLSTADFFMNLLDMKNRIASDFEQLGLEYGEGSFYKQSLDSAARKIKASPAKREKLLKKISVYADRPYLDDELYDLNHEYYGGEVGAIYGEIGELVVAALLSGVEKRGGYTYQMFAEIDSLGIPQEIRAAIRKGKKQNDLLHDFFKSKIPAEKYDEVLLSSILNKELDIVRGNSREWIEVKNYKHMLTWETRGDHQKVIKQARKTHEALEMLGVRGEISLKQTFVNCVDQMFATKFMELYGIEIIGCIR